MELNNYNTPFIEKRNCEIIERLKRDNPQCKADGAKLTNLTCPKCRAKEAYTYLNNPNIITCNRKNNCKAQTYTREIYKDLFDNYQYAKNFPKAKNNPNATAEAYLQNERGLDTTKFEFLQGEWKVSDKIYQTVKIKVDDGIFWHRLIDYPAKDKVRFDGEYAGKFYTCKKILDTNKDIYIVESPIDALSLNQAGFEAVSCFSCSHFSKDFYKNLPDDAKLVLALDPDNAGRDGTKKNIKYLKENRPKIEKNTKIALPPDENDWNDLLVSNALSEKDMEQYLWRGAMFHTEIEGDAQKWFEIYCSKKKKGGNKLFYFNKKLYVGNVKRVNDDDIYSVYCCSTATIFVKTMRKDKNTGKIQYTADVVSQKGKNRITFSADELASATKLKTHFTNIRENLMFNNFSKVYDLFINYINNQKVVEISKLNQAGYDRESKCYAFNNFLYCPDGKRYKINEDGYFDVFNVQPFGIPNMIEEYKEIELRDFLVCLENAFGYKGLLSMGFWMATTFSHIIFDEFRLFPFLLLYGDPYCGKSTLTYILNSCFFVNEEGLSMSRDNTGKGELRKLNQKSSMVVGMIESHEGSRLDYEQLLPSFNRNSLQVRAQKTNDNKTYDMGIDAGLAFVQNKIALFSKKALKSRFVRLKFNEEDLPVKKSPETGEQEPDLAPLNKLEAFSPEEYAYIGHFILSNRKFFEENIIVEINNAKEELRSRGILNDRICTVYAIVLAPILMLMEMCLKEDEKVGKMTDLVDFTVSIAKEAIETLNTEDALVEDVLQAILDEPQGIESGYITKDNGTLLAIHKPTVTELLKKKGKIIDSQTTKELKKSDAFAGMKLIYFDVGLLK